MTALVAKHSRGRRRIRRSSSVGDSPHAPGAWQPCASAGDDIAIWSTRHRIYGGRCAQGQPALAGMAWAAGRPSRPIQLRAGGHFWQRAVGGGRNHYASVSSVDRHGYITILQPDLSKTGGVTGHYGSRMASAQVSIVLHLDDGLNAGASPSCAQSTMRAISRVTFRDNLFRDELVSKLRSRRQRLRHPCDRPRTRVNERFLAAHL